MTDGKYEIGDRVTYEVQNANGGTDKSVGTVVKLTKVRVHVKVEDGGIFRMKAEWLKLADSESP